MGNNIAYGVDLGLMSQLEAEGCIWVNEKNEKIDPMLAAKEMGSDSVRIRVFVNPPKEAHWQKRDGTICKLGFCDKEGVLQISERAKALDMRIMLDFHYSDHFADPQYQDIPAEWLGTEDLTSHIRQHTSEVLLYLREHGIRPEWVQVGNEINPGILLPEGSMRNAPQTLVSYLNAGYETVKEVFPDSLVITHLTGLAISKWCEAFLDRFFELGGKTDVLGFSHYPYWFKYDITTDIPALYLTKYAEKYHKPVMICEVGGPAKDADNTYELLVNTIRAVRLVPNDMGLGLFYWEPEVSEDILPDKYPLGAAVLTGEKTLQYTKALTAYNHSKKMEVYNEKGFVSDIVDLFDGGINRGVQ